MVRHHYLDNDIVTPELSVSALANLNKSLFGSYDFSDAYNTSIPKDKENEFYNSWIPSWEKEFGRKASDELFNYDLAGLFVEQMEQLLIKTCILQILLNLIILFLLIILFIMDQMVLEEAGMAKHLLLVLVMELYSRSRIIF